MSIRSVLGRMRARHELRAARRQTKAFCRTHPAQVRVCWDLDNTLVDSGILLQAGKSLDEAIVEAYPVANMLAFYEAMRAQLPQAEHFILTARRRSMRGPTLDWFERHGLDARPTGVCLIPCAAAKPQIWRQLAADAPLVIVDDLSFNHERDTPNLHHDLIAHATRTAMSYVDLDDIAAIAADPTAVARITERILAAVSPHLENANRLLRP